MHVLHWNIPCSWSDYTSSVLSLLWGVQQILQQGSWRSLRAVIILLARLKDAFIWYWRARFLMAPGFQWTKYCSWDVLFANHPKYLFSFGADLAGQLFLLMSFSLKLKYLILNSGCPRLVCKLLSILALVLPEHVCEVLITRCTEVMTRSFLFFIRHLNYI